MLHLLPTSIIVMFPTIAPQRKFGTLGPIFPLAIVLYEYQYTNERRIMIG